MQERKQLAMDKAREYQQRDDVVAVALTGSIAREMTWEGSDIDLYLYVFVEGEGGFEDGLVCGVYWEADILPIQVLDVCFEDPQWLQPPKIFQGAERVLEALWGCQVIYDLTGLLSRAKRSVDQRMEDRNWLAARIGNYLAYGQGCLDTLAYVEPLRAIIGARCVATDYGIVAYRMQQGQLLTSVCRIPEMLGDDPTLQQLYMDIFGLCGQEGAERFLRDCRRLPAHVQQAIARDLELEVVPLFELGVFDGPVRHIRQGLPLWSGQPAEAVPILALQDDLERHKQEVLTKASALLMLCAQEARRET